MLLNYLKSAWRNLLRHRVMSMINFTGLALALTATLFILLWVQDERSVDAFHQHSASLYQVYERNHYDGKVDASYSTQGLLAQELKKTIPGVAYAAGLEAAAAPGSASTLEANQKIIKRNGYFAGEDFFSMFSFPLLKGAAATAIQAPGTVAISESLARLFFGDATTAIGQTIRFDNAEPLTVSAVFADLPANSSLQFDFLRSWADFVQQNAWVQNWGNTDPQCFVQLKPGASAAAVGVQLKNFLDRYRGADKSLVVTLALQPFAEKYLHSNVKNGYPDGGRIDYVQLFSLIAIFVLVIACINYLNLTTARAATRAREVGVRKVIGAGRGALIAQFMCEALMTTAIAFSMALILTSFLMPAFNSLTGKQLVIPFATPRFWWMLAILITITVLLSGIYPAIFLASLKPVKVLKGTLQFSWSASFLRKGLVVVQFALSVFLIIAMLVMYRQLQYIQTKNLGYTRENLVYIPIEGDLVKQYELFKQQALRNEHILQVSKMRNSPTGISHHTNSISWASKDPGLSVSFADGVVGYDFVPTMGVQLAAGRDFSREYGTDSTAYLLNETAVQKIGWKDPVGQTINWGNHPGKVIGVMKDFHFNSLHEAIEPLILRLDENWKWGTILVRIKGGPTQPVLARLEQLCKELNPKFPFTYQFSDLEFAKLYASEATVGTLASIFTGLAILIAALGLFGLAIFTAEQRRKEIGVRKVLGASVVSIVRLLSLDFLRPILLAILLASPVAWFLMQHWLEGYAYRIELNGLLLLAAALLAMVVAFLTVGAQAIKAALANPVKSLRSE